MYCSIIKKTKLTNEEKLLKFSSNISKELLAIGGTKGFVQILSYPTKREQISLKDSLKFSYIDLSQKLIYHKSNVSIILWNEKKEKLTTCDENGIIVIWYLKNEKWETQMINNRKKSIVSDIKWSKQGNYICFSYLDGHAILGSVEGERKWGEDFNNTIYIIEFTNNEKNILFACENYDILIVSLNGTQIGKIELENSLINIKIVSLRFWDGFFFDNDNIEINENENDEDDLRKNLIVSFQNSYILFYNNENDKNYKKIKVEYLETIIKSEWSNTGDLIAICGNLINDDKKMGICFYNNQYECIYFLLCPEIIYDFNFYSSKIFLLSETAVYFGLFKSIFKWCYLNDTLIYAILTEIDYYTVIFWNTELNEYKYKYVRNMIGICSFNSLCLITSKNEDNNYLLILCNSIGYAIDNKIVNIEPIFYNLNDTHIVISNENYVYLWQFREFEKRDNEGNEYSNSPLILLNKDNQKEICFFIDDIPNLNMEYDLDNFKMNKSSKDQISALTLSNDFLFIVCESGKGMKYNLLSLSSIDKYNFDDNINSIGMSLTSKYLWTINEKNILNLYDIEKDDKKYKMEKINYEKKDVWAIQWEKIKANEKKEDHLSFVYYEKNKLNIINNLITEDVKIIDAYLADYSNMIITLVRLEELMKKNWETKHNVNDIIIKIEHNFLKKFNEIINDNDISLTEILKYVEENPSDKLWKELAKHALDKLNFDIAEKCFIQTNDYNGLQLIKKLKNIDDDNLKKAEIAQYFNDYDQAEKILKENKRDDLIVDMNMKLDKWDKVIDVMKENGINEDDENMKISLSNQADKLFENKDYDKAEEYYKKAGNKKGLINVYFAKEDYEKAGEIIKEFEDGDENLDEIGDKFVTLGLLDEAVECYIKNNNIKKAINTCITLNRWDKAMEIAEKYNYYEINDLLKNFSDDLLKKGKKMDLIDFFYKSHRYIDAAKLINQIAEEFILLKMNPLTMKKIYVFYALTMENYNPKVINKHYNEKLDKNDIQVKSTFDNLINTDLSNLTRKILNNYWRGAEAFHFYMLCQVHLYRNNYKDALKCSLRLVLYEKYLGTRNVYCLIALSAFLNKSYKYCSKAISILENLDYLSKRLRDGYRKLGINLFINNNVENIGERFLKCPNCNNEISEFALNCNQCRNNFSACVISGKSIFTKDYFKCKRCSHKTLKSEIIGKNIKHCPMCHVYLGPKKKE